MRTDIHETEKKPNINQKRFRAGDCGCMGVGWVAMEEFEGR